MRQRRQADSRAQLVTFRVRRPVIEVDRKLTAGRWPVCVDRTAHLLAHRARQGRAAPRHFIASLHAAQRVVELFRHLDGYKACRCIVGFGPVKRDAKMRTADATANTGIRIFHLGLSAKGCRACSVAHSSAPTSLQKPRETVFFLSLCREIFRQTDSAAEWDQAMAQASTIASIFTDA